MRRYCIRFYRKFFSQKGRKFIINLAYYLILLWFICFLVQLFIYPKYIIGEWYLFYFIYCFLFYFIIVFSPWSRYTLFSKLRVFQIFSCASVFVVYTTIDSLYSFLILNQKPWTAYPVFQSALSVVYKFFG